MRIRSSFCALYLFSAIAAHAELKLVVSVSPKDLHRGEKVTYTITNPPANIVYTNAVVRRRREFGADTPDPKIPLLPVPPVAPETLTTAYTSTITSALLYGDYDLVRLESATEPAKNNIEPQGDLRFRIDAAAAPRIDTVDPPVVYPDPYEQYQLTVVGANFSPNRFDNALMFDGHADLPMCDDAKPGDACITVVSASVDGRQVVFGNIDHAFMKAGGFFGARKVRVRAGSFVSDAERIPATTLSMVGRRTPLKLAAAITLGLLFLLVLVLATARSNTPGHPYALLAMALLDTDSNTYSLSKAQFYSWTIVAVFGYAFLTLSKWLVQGKFEMPNIPENLPGIIFISAGTATLAMGMGNARPKGSGTTTPSLGDFATTGGVVAPDRVQFLVWTIVGIVAFIGLLIQAEPGTLNELPKIPEGFLYLMGIASAGYLGGKLARQPGPNVTGAVGQQSTGSTNYVVEVTGRNLSVEAGIYFDDVYVSPQWLATNAAGAITFPGGITAKEKFRLALVNPDGQRSEYQVP